jgi:hypothetical protein
LVGAFNPEPQAGEEGTMIKTLLLTTALIGGFFIAHAVTDAAKAQRASAERRIILMDAAPSREAQGERRVALVVGNSNYEGQRISLSNPKNDADDMAAKLRKLGFEVLTAIDATKQEFESKVAEFARLGKNADMALFYYAGHALQFQGQNYLMPVDGELKDGDSIWSMVRVEDVRRALDRVTGLKVMILDACRNNPLSDRMYRGLGGGGIARGLARIDKTQGMIVAYATAADQVAEDGNGRNSPFTGALLGRLDEAGLEVTKMFRLVGSDVSNQTGGRQRPEIIVQSYNDYFLNQTDRAAWEKIKNSSDAPALRNFMQSFPSSPFSAVARDRLDRSMPTASPKVDSPQQSSGDQPVGPKVPDIKITSVQPQVSPDAPALGGQVSIPKLDIPKLDIGPHAKPADPPVEFGIKPIVTPSVIPPPPPPRTDHGLDSQKNNAIGPDKRKPAHGHSDRPRPDRKDSKKDSANTTVAAVHNLNSVKPPPQPQVPIPVKSTQGGAGITLGPGY